MIHQSDDGDERGDGRGRNGGIADFGLEVPQDSAVLGATDEKSAGAAVVAAGDKNRLFRARFLAGGEEGGLALAQRGDPNIIGNDDGIGIRFNIQKIQSRHAQRRRAAARVVAVAALVWVVTGSGNQHRKANHPERMMPAEAGIIGDGIKRRFKP